MYHKLYVVDYRQDKIYIYTSTGTYESSFDLYNSGAPLGITVYSNKFYISDWSRDRVFIYPFD